MFPQHTSSRSYSTIVVLVPISAFPSNFLPPISLGFSELPGRLPQTLSSSTTFTSRSPVFKSFRREILSLPRGYKWTSEFGKNAAFHRVLLLFVPLPVGDARYLSAI